jgi:hypothetical protein
MLGCHSTVARVTGIVIVYTGTLHIPSGIYNEKVVDNGVSHIAGSGPPEPFGIGRNERSKSKRGCWMYNRQRARTADGNPG